MIALRFEIYSVKSYTNLHLAFGLLRRYKAFSHLQQYNLAIQRLLLASASRIQHVLLSLLVTESYSCSNVCIEMPED